MEIDTVHSWLVWGRVFYKSEDFGLEYSLRSRRLEVVGTRKNGRVSPSRAPVLSLARYFQAPATQAI